MNHLFIHSILNLIVFNLSNFRLGASFEGGLLLSLYTEFKELLKLHVQRNVEFYESLDDFVSDISQKVSPYVKLDNVQNLFLYFGSFLMLVLLVYVIDIFLFKQLKRINRKLVRCFANLLQEVNVGLSLFEGR